MPTIVCGWCSDRCNQAPFGEVAVHRQATRPPYRYDAVYRCDGCEHLSILTWTSFRSPAELEPIHRDQQRIEPQPGEPFRWQPAQGTQQTFKGLPKHIEAVATEAYLCHAAGVDQAAVALARAVVESAAKTKGIEEVGIETKIQKLVELRVIRPSVGEQAHAIRAMGNSVAHGDREGWATHEEAAMVLYLMSKVLEEVWETPAVMEGLNAAVEEKKQKS